MGEWVDAAAGVPPFSPPPEAALARDQAQHTLVVEDCSDPRVQLGEGYAGYAVLPRPVRLPPPADED